MKKIIIALLIATVAGLAISTWSTASNVSACVQAPGCTNLDKQPNGKITTFKQGFPATYRTTVKFMPSNNNQNSPDYAGYAEASATIQNTSPVLAVLNVLFWFSPVYIALKYVPLPSKRKSTPPVHPSAE